MVPSGALTPHLALARMHPGPRIAPEQRRKRTVSDLCASVDPSDTHGGAREGAGRKAKEGDVNQGENFPLKKQRKTGANSPERIIARLKRDAATDTHAAALLGRIDPSAWPSSAPSRLLARLALTHSLLWTPRGS